MFILGELQLFIRPAVDRLVCLIVLPVVISGFVPLEERLIIVGIRLELRLFRRLHCGRQVDLRIDQREQVGIFLTKGKLLALLRDRAVAVDDLPANDRIAAVRNNQL